MRKLSSKSLKPESIGHAIGKIRVGMTNDHFVRFCYYTISICILEFKITRLLSSAIIARHVLIDVILRKES